MNKKSIRKNFNFLIQNGWFLHNSSAFVYKKLLPTKKNSKYKACENIELYNILLSDKLYIFDKIYFKTVLYENNIYQSNNFDNNALEYKIYNNLKKNISFLEMTTKDKKQLEILKEYTKLLKEYEFYIRKIYSELGEDWEWTRLEKILTVRSEPNSINFMINPSFELEKEAFIAYQKKYNYKCANPDSELTNYFNKKYKILFKEITEENNYKDINKVYLKMIKKDPITSAEIVKRDISKEVLTEALRVFPELLFLRIIKNKELLCHNKNVYNIINSDPNNYIKYKDIILDIINNNLKSIDDNKGNYNDLEFCNNARKKLNKIIDIKTRRGI